jgi:hypothetical protein
MLRTEPAVGEVLTIEVAKACDGENIVRKIKVMGSKMRLICSPPIFQLALIRPLA